MLLFEGCVILTVNSCDYNDNMSWVVFLPLTLVLKRCQWFGGAVELQQGNWGDSVPWAVVPVHLRPDLATPIGWNLLKQTMKAAAGVVVLIQRGDVILT